MEGSKALLCSGAHTCSLPLYVLLFLCSSCSVLLPLPQSPFPKVVLWLSHRYPEPPVLCHPLLVITHIQPLLKEVSDLESFSFPAVLLTKHHSSVFQPCRWLAPPLGEWQFTLQDDLPINVYTVWVFFCFYFQLFCKKIKPECFVTWRVLCNQHNAAVTHNWGQSIKLPIYIYA